MNFPTSLLASLSASSVRWAETLLSISMNRRSVSKRIARTQPRGARGQDADQAGRQGRDESRLSRNYGSYYIIIPRVVARDGMIIPGGDAPFESIPEPTLQYLPSPDRFHSPRTSKGSGQTTSRQ
jgi:hypothetical protein